jgi:dephospho-CoA kinase
MLKIGLTGGIGSGKSTVAEYFAALGATVIDADVIVHELLENDQNIIAEITNHFGKDAITPENKVNRRYLRQLIFRAPTERQWLEKLLHPKVYAIITQRITELAKSTSTPYSILAIPLLLETEQRNFVDRVLVVDTPEDVQIQRIVERDKTSATEVHAIMASQLNRTQRNALADDIICNDHNLEHLKKQVQNLHNKYLALVSKKNKNS